MYNASIHLLWAAPACFFAGAIPKRKSCAEKFRAWSRLPLAVCLKQTHPVLTFSQFGPLEPPVLRKWPAQGFVSLYGSCFLFWLPGLEVSLPVLKGKILARYNFFEALVRSITKTSSILFMVPFPVPFHLLNRTEYSYYGQQPQQLCWSRCNAPLGTVTFEWQSRGTFQHMQSKTFVHMEMF